jgi:hypothetical protein
MFRSFVRMLGLANETARTSKVGGFSPRLETLDGRELPSTMTIAAGFDATPAAVRSVAGSDYSSAGMDTNGVMPGGVLGDRAGAVRLDGGMSGGVLTDRAGTVSLDGGASGGVLGDRAGKVSLPGTVEMSRARSAGEEIPQ